MIMTIKRQYIEEQNNIVVGVEGLKGGGKTLVMTFLLLQEYLKGKKVYTNYKVNFPHEYIDIQKLVKLDISLKNAVIGIDEIHMIADSRRSGNKKNMLISYFILQSRHRNVNFYYTTQYQTQTDKRIRENTDINIVCENLYVDSDEDGMNDLFRLIVQDNRFMQIKQKILYGKPYFDMYDSSWIVDIFTMKKTKRKHGLGV